MDSANTYWSDRALLEWQVELGATDAILDAPVDRYALEGGKPAPKPTLAPKRQSDGRQKRAPISPLPQVQAVDAIGLASAAASSASDLPALAAALAAFEHCELKRGARSFVFSGGNPAARVMIISEAPSREEDRAGRPFVGRTGQLLDRMFDAIQMGRSHEDAARSLYMTNVLPWRTPSNRAPDDAEIAVILPFLERHVELANPDILVLMGSMSCQALLGRNGISRMRGTWTKALGKPCLPMLHPDHLLRNPIAKREAWADLLELNAHLRGSLG
jgi:uracil-DNA glycosylase family 4